MRLTLLRRESREFSSNAAAAAYTMQKSGVWDAGMEVGFNAWKSPAHFVEWLGGRICT